MRETHAMRLLFENLQAEIVAEFDYELARFEAPAVSGKFVEPPFPSFHLSPMTPANYFI